MEKKEEKGDEVSIHLPQFPACNDFFLFFVFSLFLTLGETLNKLTWRK